VAATFAGKITLSEIVPPNSYTISFDGQGGAAGFGKGNAQVTLTPDAAGSGCELAYTVHASVGGKIAQLGQRLIDGAAKSMAEDFFKRFDEDMQHQYPAAYASKPIAAHADFMPAGGTFVSKVPRWAWIGGAVVLVVLYLALR